MRTHTQQPIWQRSMDLMVLIYDLTSQSVQTAPLAVQLHRVAVELTDTIADCCGQSITAQQQCLHHAQGLLTAINVQLAQAAQHSPTFRPTCARAQQLAQEIQALISAKLEQLGPGQRTQVR